MPGNPHFAQNIILGVLEESKGHYAGEPNYRDIRVIFQKSGGVWQPFQSDCQDQACLKVVSSTYPSETKWTIAFDGRNLGQVVSHAPSDFRWYSDVGQKAIISTNPVPTVGTRSAEFGGYTEASVYRPLVANSKAYFADADRWKPVAPSSEVATLLQQAFRKKYSKLCRISQTDQNKLGSALKGGRLSMEFQTRSPDRVLRMSRLLISFDSVEVSNKLRPACSGDHGTPSLSFRSGKSSCSVMVCNYPQAMGWRQPPQSHPN
jgi:hypothetical protein